MSDAPREIVIIGITESGATFRFLLGFARDNELRLRRGGDEPHPPASGGSGKSSALDEPEGSDKDRGSIDAAVLTGSGRP